MKTAVIKLSGKAVDDFLTDANWLEQLKIFKSQYDALIIVHGAGTMISEWATKLGCKTEFLNGQRVTNLDMMEVVAAVQNGLINAKLVSHLQTKGINAAGFNGIDHGLFVADYVNSELGYVGIPKAKENSDWLESTLQSGTLPVFSSICRDEIGNLMNVNADLFTISIAEIVKADSVIFLSDIEGVKIYGKTRDEIDESDITSGISNGDITDGMIPKLQSAVNLLKQGINKVWIGNNLENVNSTKNKKGTWVVNNSKLSA
ncbi:MAG: acetylglutamate kinase [Melioribacteraceae bacterium]|nr:acetylglutamate kinase [Melioribacteraceae bacterium]MCF8263529.1 acetylglutamate kinase [Melioribacteraceae bacterium]MCF8411887.1 acetylglutamate kinase [Melioribacteraceae bacterium]MCF8431540.1 acetylglutamate kinase [Melioribacteraceae bacterium]